MKASPVSQADIRMTSIYAGPNAFIDKRGTAYLVRPLEPKWHAQLVGMYLAIQPRGEFSGLPPVRDEECEKWVNGMISSGLNLVALAFEEGLIGHVGLFPINATTCELLVALASGRRNMGVGTQLTRQAVQLAYELDFEHVWLNVGLGNRIAQHVYAKCGFRFVPGGDRDEFEMVANLEQFSAIGNITVADVMNRRVLTIHENDTCQEAVETLLDHRLGALPVVGDDGRVVGILSETDLITLGCMSQRVKEVCTRQVVSVTPDNTLTKVVRLFQLKKIRVIPVLDSDGMLVGMLGRRDVLSHFVRGCWGAAGPT